MRKLNHPALLIAIVAVCVVLWMPFGMGYYGWPWEAAAGRIGIQVMAFGFLAIAAVSIVTSLRPEVRVVRLSLSVLALLASLYGLFALYSWKDSYLESVRRRGSRAEEKPNKAPEPTTTAVTPRAMEVKTELKTSIPNPIEACVAPAVVVAHL